MTLADLPVKDFSYSNAYLEGEKFIHPDYKSHVTRDAALIRVKSPIKPSTLRQNASLNSICLPEMSKVIDKQLNEYAMLLGWGVPGNDMRLTIGYTKINHGTIENEKVDEFKQSVVTKKLDNIQLCSVGVLKFSNQCQLNTLYGQPYLPRLN